MGAFSLLFLITLLLLASCSNVRARVFITRPNVKLKDYIYDTVNVLSRFECVLVCSRSSLCSTVSWNSVHRQCLLSVLNAAYVVPDTLTGSYVYTQDWDTFGEDLYPVALYTGPEGRYTLTYNQGEQLCIDEGTQIATLSQLLGARSMGLEVCICGWLAGGLNGFVLQQENYGCWTDYSNGVANLFDCLPYRPLANVWCAVK